MADAALPLRLAAWPVDPPWLGAPYLLVLAAAALAGFVGGRRGRGRAAGLGALLTALGLAGLAATGPAGPAPLALLPPVAALAAYGAGQGLFQVALRAAVLRAAPIPRSAAAVALLLAAGHLGLLAAPHLLRLGPDRLPEGGEPVLVTAWLGLAALAALAAALMAAFPGRAGPPPGSDAVPNALRPRSAHAGRP